MSANERATRDLVMARLLGIEGDDDRRELDARIEANAELASEIEVATDFARAEDLRGDHVTADDILAWHDLERTRHPFEVDLLRHHVRRCEACQATLFRAHGLARPTRSGGRFGAGRAAALAVAATLLAVWLWPSGVEVAHDHLPRVIPSRTRGSSDVLNLSTLPSRVLVDLGAPMDFLDVNVVHVDIVDPNGVVVFTSDGEPGELRRRSAVVTVPVVGRYQVRFRAPSGATDARSFEIVTDPE